MKKRILINIAKALLLARWRQTLVAAIGVTFSITMFITLLGFMNGLNDLLDGLILNRTPHIKLYNDIKPNANQPIKMANDYKGKHHFIQSIKSDANKQAIYNSQAIMNSLQKDARVIGFTQKLTAQVFFINGTTDITGVLNGVNASEESKLFHFDDYIVSGNASDLDRETNTIILGKSLAEKLLVNIGDVIQLSTANGDRFQLKVVGYFQSGLKEIDIIQSFASIHTVQKIMNKPNNFVTEIDIKLKDINLSIPTAKEYAQLYQTDAEDIQTANAQFETGSAVRSIISYAVGITLLVVAGFGIYNILNMMILKKWIQLPF